MAEWGDEIERPGLGRVAHYVQQRRALRQLGAAPSAGIACCTWTAVRTLANGNSRRLSARQRRAAAERTWHPAPGAARAVRHLRGSGADGQSVVSDRDASHG